MDQGKRIVLVELEKGEFALAQCPEEALLRRGHLRKSSKTAASALLTLRDLEAPKYLFCFWASYVFVFCSLTILYLAFPCVWGRRDYQSVRCLRDSDWCGYFPVPHIKGLKDYPRRANLSSVWKFCPEKERPVGGSVLLCFILLMLYNSI